MAPTHTATWDFRMIAQSLEEYNNVGYDEGDGTERQAVVRALFKDDRRLNEAQNLLSTHRLRVVRLNPIPLWTEPEYLEKQKELVATIATSTLAIPAGRGLLYYNLRFPLLTQKFFIGGFNLTCVVKPANNTVGVEKSLFTEEKVNWAFFHQGVAGGLAISPNAKGIDTSWILYNKPGQDLSNRHAGFLLALGLNGHLKSVAKWVAFKYLTPKHTMTSIGLLLGLAASYLGTMDSLITRLLSVHVTRMLPRGAAELNLSHHTQTTGIMGIGLLYCNSQHRRMSEIMMSEIEFVDDEDDEDPLRNEGYRLAAGFALGFINLGKGTDLKGLHDMRLTEKLLTLASSTKKVEEVNVLDRSAPGAVMAIALIFMKSEDHIVARKVDVPESILQFGYIRPDILLLRTLAKNLILWSQVQPTFPWIKASLPREFSWRYQLTGTHKLQSKDMPFFSIIAGLCFAIGLRYAGSANMKVRDLLVHYLDQFIRISRLDSGNYDAQLSRNTVQMCMDVVALSAASVMAGTGDLVVMRRLRSLHGRDDAETSYGSHLAAHLAIGTLFLGCGTATFSTSNMAIAALLVAFYPIFPADVQDNRSHLQAFRHFWVLATDPRCLVAKDVATGQPVSVPILIKLKKTPLPSVAKLSSPRKRSKLAPQAAEGSEDSVIRRITPCLLPPLEDISTVRTDATTQGFWNVELNFEKDPSLITSFRKNQSLHLRRRNLHEGAFGATVRALGRDDLEFPDTANVLAADEANPTRRAHNPLEWVFEQDALNDLTHAERAVVLNSQGGDIGDEGAGSAVDARLVLEAGMDGWSRENLQGLKFLFEWADKRSLPQDAKQEQGSSPETPKKTSNKGKGKVRMKDDPVPDASKDSSKSVSEETNGWWLRDSVVEMLKGKAWLAARDDET
ncbi:putative 20s cyclosome subunit (apc1) protein [Phaeoacremonium minimum UCRPA7]|uniref:Putative 20s cyclosome subunit (Apc1 ) protein n=1 Tax=Phaeoacremonium minimum (strain UCR-PA7) TaxID=1286976 RepID=R8BAV6_PHAM7|nr:putative 20s cyclosome subunit (apc1) protein [Phaeoacremonium minimum UCRPA7]EON96435.1 putative 20s cyclosome subunit (apc1) protein [Phaeoacremonium minimum UCRPA7]